MDDRGDRDDTNSALGSRDVAGSLLAALAGGGAVGRVSAEFARQEGHAAKVRYARGLLVEHGLRLQRIPRAKDDRAAEGLREAGNAAFRRKRLSEAAEAYTRSLATAAAADLTALAYANRSAVLLKTGMYQDCLHDIDNAFLAGYPVHLYEKLTRRKETALKHLLHADAPRPEPYYEPAPALSYGENDSIELASSAVTIAYSEDEGRKVVAVHNIRPGDVLSCDKPFAVRLERSCAYTHCNFCLERCPTLLPCDECPDAMFCSDKCKKSAWSSYHKYECPIAYSLEVLQSKSPFMLALRVTLQARHELDMVETYEMNATTTEAPKKLYRAANYEEIHNLVTMEASRSVANLFQRAVDAAAIMDLLETETDLFPTQDVWDRFAHVLYHHLMTAPVNMHTIGEKNFRDAGNEGLTKIGSGAYAFLSMLNHSCCPNVIRFCHGTTVALIAVRPIKQGEEVFDDYGAHFAVMDRQQRAEVLQQYLFTCKCKACVDDWPLFIKLPSSDTVVSLEDIEALGSGCKATARRLIEVLCNRLAELDVDKPSYEGCTSEECLKQCYFIFGNRCNHPLA